MMRRYTLILLCLLLSLPVSMTAKGKKDWPAYDLKRHEFALYGAIFPGRYAFGYDFSFFPRMYDVASNYNSVLAQYEKAKVYNVEKVTNTWSFSYTYNFSRIFALSASLSYEGGWNENYYRSDDTLAEKTECHYLTPMITARFSWLNRNIVRLYSSVGAGMAVSLTDVYYTTSDKGVHTHPDTYVSLQVTPIGISVGKKLYGFFELGVGTIYLGGCIGMGYRF